MCAYGFSGPPLMWMATSVSHQLRLCQRRGTGWPVFVKPLAQGDGVAFILSTALLNCAFCVSVAALIEMRVEGGGDGDGGESGEGGVAGGDGGGGLGGGIGGDATVRSTGSHCGGQATPRMEGRAFELGWPVAYVSSGSCTTTASAGELRILQYLLMGQALEPKLTISASLLATLGSGTYGLLL